VPALFTGMSNGSRLAQRQEHQHAKDAAQQDVGGDEKAGGDGGLLARTIAPSPKLAGIQATVSARMSRAG